MPVLKILLMVLIVIPLLVSGGYISCASSDDAGDAIGNLYDLSDDYCWGVQEWGDEPYHLGGTGYVFCWDGYGIGYWNNCWVGPNAGCWDGYDVFCRDDGGEGAEDGEGSWQGCYDYYMYGKTWRGTAW
jgi:hypothetical protein